MEDGFTILAPRRRVIRPGEESLARAQWAHLLWTDPEAAKRAALEARLRYWQGRAVSIQAAIKRLEAMGRRDRCSYIDEMRPLRADLIEVQARLEALVVEAARFSAKLSGPFQPTTGSSGRPRRRRRRVVSDQGRARRRRVAAAAG
jgi:hypothetical protein